MRYTFYGKIENGKLVLDNQYMFREFISKQKDQKVELVIRSPQEDSTANQYRYLYGSVYSTFAESFGWTVEEVDYYMKERFMREHLIFLPRGLTLSKSSFDKHWLAKYIECCIRYCAEQGVVVPPPRKGD